MTGSFALVRLAIRQIRRDKARSLLVVAVIALMVGTATTAATVARTTSTGMADQLGQSDVAVAETFARSFVLGTDDSPSSASSSQLELLRQNLQAELGAETAVGIRIGTLPASEPVVGGPFSNGYRPEPQVLATDFTSAILDGALVLVDGRFPESADEVALHPRLLQQWSVSVGDEVELESETRLVVGSANHAMDPFSRGLPIFTTIEGFDAIVDERHSVAVLLQGVDVDDAPIREVASSVAADTLGVEDDRLFVSLKSDRGFYDSGGLIAPTERPRQLGVLVAALLGIQVVLVAAAAFAVGVRRRTRQFGQLQAVGADNRHLRRGVLVEGALLGGLGSVVGSILGLAVAVALHRSEALLVWSDWTVAELRWSLLDALGPAALGVGAAALAAWWPTQQLKSLSPVVALGGHIPATPPSRRVPAFGIGLLAAGFGLFALSLNTPFYGELVILLAIGSIVLIFFGALSVIGLVIDRLGTLADRLPLLARLVTRNSARHRSRAWVAVGALVASMSLPVIIGASTLAYPNSYGNPDSELSSWVRVGLASYGEEEPSDLDEVVRSAQTAYDVAEFLPASDIDRFFELLDVEVGQSFDLVDTLRFENVIGDDGEDIAAFPLYGNTERAVAERSVVLVATPELLAAIGVQADVFDGVDSPEAIVVPGSRGPTLSGEVRLVDQQLTATVIDAQLPFSGYGPMTIVSPETAAELGTATRTRSIAWQLPTDIDQATEEEFQALANRAWAELFGPGITSVTDNAPESVESAQFLGMHEPELRSGAGGSGPSAAVTQLIALGLAVGLALLVSFATSALAAVEIEQEVGSMVAVGASPSIRPRLLGLQSAYHLLIAGVLGIPVALALFWTATSADTNGPAGPTIPWLVIAVMLTVVPAVVGGAIALTFRGRQPALRRA